MKRTKAVLLTAIIITISLSTTGCGLIDYLTRENVGKSAEKYMEKQYGGNFEVVDYTCENSFKFFWNKHNWSVALKTDALPDQIVKVGAIVSEDGKSYTFYERYQVSFHRKELDNIITNLSKKYLSDDYFCTVSAGGDSLSSNSNHSLMTLSELSDENWYYSISIITDESDLEAVYKKVVLFQKEIEDQYKIYCGWYLYSIEKNDESIESRVIDENNKFNPFKDSSLKTVHSKEYKKEWE